MRIPKHGKTVIILKQGLQEAIPIQQQYWMQPRAKYVTAVLSEDKFPYVQDETYSNDIEFPAQGDSHNITRDPAGCVEWQVKILMG